MLLCRPFPIVLGSLFQKVNTTSLFYPCEFTPEYIGVPPVYPNEQPNKTIGGGFVDTYVSWHAVDADVAGRCQLLSTCMLQLPAQQVAGCGL